MEEGTIGFWPEHLVEATRTFLIEQGNSDPTDEDIVSFLEDNAAEATAAE